MDNICCSVKSQYERQNRCSFNKYNGTNYCYYHNNTKNKIDYVTCDNFEYEDDIDNEKRLQEMDNFAHTKPIINSLIDDRIIIKSKIDTEDNSDKNIAVIDLKAERKRNKSSDTESMIKSVEQMEEEMKMNLLIIANNPTYSKKISDMLGPAFDDITISDNNEEPLTYDTIWTVTDGKKVPGPISKYFLFSYTDSNNKIICLHISTIKNMVDDDTFIHPITGNEMDSDSIDRAKKIVQFYDEHLGMFNISTNYSSNSETRNKLINIFKKFHSHSAYFEDKWILDIMDINILKSIMKKTQDLLMYNIKEIDAKIKRNDFMDINSNSVDWNDVDSIHKYIVDSIEFLIKTVDINKNQLPIWIIAGGLCGYVKEIAEKYPQVEYMTID